MRVKDLWHLRQRPAARKEGKGIILLLDRSMAVDAEIIAVVLVLQTPKRRREGKAETTATLPSPTNERCPFLSQQKLLEQPPSELLEWHEETEHSRNSSAAFLHPETGVVQPCSWQLATGCTLLM